MFGRFFGKADSIKDPVLGALKRDESGWSGTITWPHSEWPFSICVFRKTGEPTEGDRLAFRSLQAVYPSLVPMIRKTLLEMWTPVEKRDELPKLETPEALWRELILQGVWIHGDGRAELCYGFNDDERWLAGAFILGVLGRNVRAVRYEE